MNDIYKNNEEYNPNKKRKIFDENNFPHKLLSTNTQA